MKVGTIVLLAIGAVAYLAAAWVGYRYVWLAVFPPDEQSIVLDEAEALTTEQARFIHGYHKQLLHEHDIDYRTVIPAAETVGDINAFAFNYFTEHRVGGLSQSGRGLLLVIDTENDIVRLEVSQALEGVYTDRFVSYIQHRQMIPFFRSQRVGDGILASTELIFSRAQDAERGRAFMPPVGGGTAGGGAVNPARIGAGRDERFRAGPDVAPAANDPRMVLAAYRDAMERRNGNPGLSIYTRETRAFLGRRVMTPAQMDNEAQKLKECPEAALKVDAGHAVLRYPVALRQCPPYFFRIEDGEWRLDLTMMSKAIRFNHRNQWHFDAQYHLDGRPYSFAFTDWRVDRHGFPHTAEPSDAQPARDASGSSQRG